jgi:TPR repeat protein
MVTALNNMTPDQIREQILSSIIPQEVVKLMSDAEAGNAESQFELGKMYDKGNYISRNKCEAVRWYKLAVAQGEHRAETNLGSMFLLGDGVETNVAEGVRLTMLAAEGGRAIAQLKLGAIYLGLVKECSEFPKNEELGIKYLQKAAEQGEENAIKLLNNLNKT